MSMPRFISKVAVFLSAALLATAAFAHPKLLSSTPADKSEVSAPSNIELKFSETLVTKLSAASLVMTSMPGMADHGPMKVSVNVSGASDGKTMVITPAQPMQPGAYRVEWRAVSSDTHTITGNFTFQVK